MLAPLPPRQSNRSASAASCENRSPRRLPALFQNGIVAPFLIGALLLLWTSAASAQIVNVQPLIGKDRTPGWTVVAEGTLDFRSGNVNLLQTSASAVVRFIRGRHTTFVMTRGEFGIRNFNTVEERFLARHFEHLRHRVQVWKAFDHETFVQFDSDQFRRLSVRAVAGTGPRIKLVTTPKVDAAIAVLYMFEYQQIRSDDKPDAGAKSYEHRASSYFIVQVKWSDRLRLGEAVYVQPRLDRRNDLRLLSETELFFAYSRYVGFKLSVTLAFDSTPPVNVQPFDAMVKSAVQFNY